MKLLTGDIVSFTDDNNDVKYWLCNSVDYINAKYIHMGYVSANTYNEESSVKVTSRKNNVYSFDINNRCGEDKLNNPEVVDSIDYAEMAEFHSKMADKRKRGYNA